MNVKYLFIYFFKMKIENSRGKYEISYIYFFRWSYHPIKFMRVNIKYLLNNKIKK